MKKEITFKIPSPITMFFSGIIFVMFIVLIAPVEYKYIGTLYSWLYLVMSLVALFLGLVLGSRRWRLKSKIVTLTIKQDSLKKIFFMTVFLTSIGIFLRVIDKYYIRGASFSANMMENRELLSDSGANAFSVVSSFLYPLSLLLPFLFILLIRAKLYKMHHLIVVLVLSSFTFVDSVLFGSRSIMMVFLFLVFLYLYVLGFVSMKMTFKKYFFFFTFLFFFFSFSGYMFDLRTTLIGWDTLVSTQLSKYAYFMPLKDSYVLLLESLRDSSFVFYSSLGFLNFVQYMGHGIFELLYLVDTFDTEYISLGKQNFAVVVKFIYKILGIPFSFDANNAIWVRTGIYNTLFGPIYYDFAFFGVVFAFVLGYLIGYLSKKVIKGDVFLLPIYLYFLVLLFFSLVVNMITFAQGIYNLVGFIIFYMLSKLFYKKFNNKRTFI